MNDNILFNIIQIIISLSNKQTLIVDDFDNASMIYRKSFEYQIRILSNNDCIFGMKAFNINMSTNVDSKLFQNDFLLIYKKII